MDGWLDGGMDGCLTVHLLVLDGEVDGLGEVVCLVLGRKDDDGRVNLWFSVLKKQFLRILSMPLRVRTAAAADPAKK